MTSSVISTLVQSALSAASRAEAEASDQADADDFDSIVRETRRSFRRVAGSATTDARQLRRGRRKVKLWKVTTCLVRRCSIDFMPRPEECKCLTDNGFGIAKVLIDRYGEMDQLTRTLEEAYPQAPLNLVGFRLCRVDKGKKVVEIMDSSSVAALEKQIGRGKLIIVPLRDMPWPQVVSSSSVVTTLTSAASSSLVTTPAGQREIVAASPVNQNYEWQDAGTPSISFRTTANLQPVLPIPHAMTTSDHEDDAISANNVLFVNHQQQIDIEMDSATTRPQQRATRHGGLQTETVSVANAPQANVQTITTAGDQTITITVPDEVVFHSSVIDSDLQTAFSTLADYYTSAPVADVAIRRRSVLPDLLELYGSPDILESTIKVTFEGETGDDFGGLTKELFTSFWNESFKVYFRGENCKVPFLPLHRARKESGAFVAIGRVLTHMAGLVHSVPCQIARSTYVSLVFNEAADDECLINDLLLFVTESERYLIQRALDDFSNLSCKQLDALNDFFAHNELQEIPKSTEIRQQMAVIATNVLVTKPEPFIKLMRNGLPAAHIEAFWSHVTTDVLSQFVDSLRPTADRVAAALKTTEEDLRPQEAAAFYYLQQFVLGLDAEDLQAFLQFVTGATDLPSSGITVSFFGTTPSARHVVAHTCSNSIEISTAYSSVQEFKREMLMMLHSENCMEFSMA